MTAGFRILAIVVIVFGPKLQALAISFPEIVTQTKPAIVEIITFDRNGSLLKTGTGFFITANGAVVTNSHVIQGAATIAARSNSGAMYPFQGIVTQSTNTDLAILKFLATEAPYLKLGQPIHSVEGQKVLVIGNPEGLQGTVSDGIISAFRLNRSYIQITAPISPGSSGSPVLDENGEVIGVASQQLMEGQNLNFAIAVEQIKAALSILQRQSAAPKGVTSQKVIPSPGPASPNGSGFKTEESGSGPTSQVLEALDHELNSVLRQLLEHLDASAQEALKAEQVRWLREREGFRNSPTTFANYTYDRTKELQRALDQYEP